MDCGCESDDGGGYYDAFDAGVEEGGIEDRGGAVNGGLDYVAVEVLGLRMVST